MKIFNFAKTAATLLLFSTLTFGQITPVDEMKENGPNGQTPVFDKAKYEAAIDQLVGAKVKGYQAILLKDGDVVSDKFGGLARNAADGQMSVSGTTQFDLGSVQKFITGTALLHLMVKRSQWSPSKDNTLQQGLDTRVYTLFPKVWLDAIGPVEIRDITIRHLLQHRSGFDMEYTGERTVLGYIKGGMIPGNLGKYEYANINFVLAGYLLPIYEHGQLKNDYDLETSNMVKSLADSYIREKLGDRMDQIFFERIFNKMNPKIRPSCNAKAVMKDTAAYGYNSKTDNVKGVLYSQIDSSGHCVGQGGYYMSARELASYVANLFATDLILNSEARIAMNKDGDNVNERLVWSYSSKDAWIQQTYGMKNILWSAGIHPATHQRSIIIRLPQNYYLIMLANSPDLGEDMFAEGVQAFKRGMGAPQTGTIVTD